jgi:hypothetical protein
MVLVARLRTSCRRRLAAAGRVLGRTRIFSYLPPGTGFWYENSNGLAQIAVNQGARTASLAF